MHILRFLYKPIIILLLLIISGCNTNQISQDKNTELFSVIQKEKSSIKVDEKKEIRIGIDYDIILVIPPYTSEASLKRLNLEPKLIESIANNISMDENYQVFLIKDKKIVAFTVLGPEYATKDGAIIKVIYPDSLNFERKQRELRPIEISENGDNEK